MPTTIPATVAWAKIRIARPIAAATIQRALMEPSLIRLAPFLTVYYFSVAPRRHSIPDGRRIGPTDCFYLM
jgi:hypothetical protein